MSIRWEIFLPSPYICHDLCCVIQPTGVPYHRNMLKKISKVVIKLDVYRLMKTWQYFVWEWVSTNYSLWSTSVGWLSNTSLEPHQIMMPTDHWCEGSLHVTVGETRMEPDKQWLLWPVLSCQTSSFKRHFLNLQTSLSKFTIKGNVEFNFWIVWCKIPINSVVFLLT